MDVDSEYGDAASENAAQQGFGYRRGFVLGLTLAEAALLLIFVILLLLVAGFESRDRVIDRLAELTALMAEMSPPGVDPVVYAKSQLQMLSDLQQVAAESNHEWDEDFIELVRAVASTESEGTDLIDIREALKQREEKLDRMIDAVGGLKSKEDLEEMAAKLAEQDKQLLNQKGQITELRGKLGGTLPSCWVTPEGNIQFIMDVVLRSGGIKARDTVPSSRLADKAKLPFPNWDSTKIYSQAQFRAATGPLLNWSVANECRFYVKIYDGTAAHEKERYKDVLRTVEGHFYKLEHPHAAPPF